MKIPIEWLKEHVTFRMPPDVLAERLTMAGSEVVGIDKVEGETVLDLEITPNRADCLSIIGIAREVAAITGTKLKSPKKRRSAKRPRPPSPTANPSFDNSECRTAVRPAPRPIIRIEDRTGCPQYIGRLIEGVQVGPSPSWMQKRLIACGVRPINNLVDITNYVLFEYGQPLHVFDYNRLSGWTIIVRRAHTKEKITTLDEVARELSTDMLVIADARNSVAVAGVMGGVGSEVMPQTKNVLLESAFFDSVTVRRTARSLGLASESSYRFERGVDPAGVDAASSRACDLICELAGGVLGAVRNVGTSPRSRISIAVEREGLNRWLGTSLTISKVRDVLTKLSCKVNSSVSRSILRVGIPSFRRDLSQPADLYEEIARIVGFDKIAGTHPSITMNYARSEDSIRREKIQSLRRVCAGTGLTETINWALVSEAELVRCGIDLSLAPRLTNPLSQDRAYLRPSLLPGLLRSVHNNFVQGREKVCVFELGGAFGHTIGASLQTERLGIALSGSWTQTWRLREDVDFFILKALIEALGRYLRTPQVETRSSKLPWAEPHEGIEVRLGRRVVGSAGRVAHQITEAMDIKQDVWYAELSVDELLGASRDTSTIKVPSALPPVKRDLSLVVDDGVSFESVYRVIREIGQALASKIELIDRYTGKQVPENKHSLTFSIEYRETTRTLTAIEADSLHKRISDELVTRFGAQLR